MRASSVLGVVGILVMTGCGGCEPTVAGADAAVPEADAGTPPPPDGCANAASLRTDCSGTLPARIDQDTVLQKGCYLAASTPVIATGATLTLSPGVTIIFSSGAGLAISGTQKLLASGTAEEPICLTGAQPVRGAWNGLSFNGTMDNGSILDYVTIEYSGSTLHDSSAAAIKATADSRGVTVSLSHSILRENQGYGLYLGGSARVPTFASNVITKNGLGPVLADAEVVRFLDGASTYKGNDVDQIFVHCYSIDTASTWAAIDVPYYLDGSLGVSVPWTLVAPATLMVAQDAQIGITGDAASLTALGTAEKPILFTGEQKTRGFWGGLLFTNTNNPANQLAYATVEYGGHITDADVTLASTGFPEQLTLSHCTLRESQGYGLKTNANAALPGFEGNTFTRNAKGPVWTSSAAAHLLLPTNSYTGNDVDEVGLDTYSVGTATWADLGVPYRLDGIGRLRVSEVLTLEPGVVLVMTQDGFIDVGCQFDECALHAAGTAEKPITITSATKTAGSWQAIRFVGTLNGANVLDHVTVEYGGQTAAGDQAEIVATSDSHGVTLAVSNSTIQHSASGGIWLGGAARFSGSSNTFADNAGADVTGP